MARRKPSKPVIGSNDTRREIAGLRQLHQPPAIRDEEPEPEPDLEPDPLLQPRKPIHNLRRDETLRVPPHSVSAEQAVLGAVMLAPEYWWPLSIILKEEDFYRRDHALIWRVIREMMAPSNADPKIDSVTVGEAMQAQGLDEQVHPSYLVELSMTTPSAANCEAYAHIVADHAVMRRLIEAGTHLVNDGFHPDGRNSSEIMSSAIARIEDTNPRVEADGIPVRQVMKGIFDEIDARKDWNEDRLPGLRFGFPMIEECIGGLEPERTYGFGARTKMGKSVILENIATNVALEEDPVDDGYVAVFTLEMTAAQWGQRMLSHVSGVQFEKLRRPALLNDEDWERLAVATKRINLAKIKIFDKPATIEEMTARCVMLRKRHGLRLVVCDYLQLIKAPGLERRDLDIGHNSWGLKELSKRCQTPVGFAFQINRGNEQGSSVRPPRPSDARESGNIEQDLDMMGLLHRPGYYDKSSKGCRFEVALQRDGRTGVFELEEQLDRSRFMPTTREWIENTQARGASKGTDTGFD